MPIETICQGCARKLRVPDEHAGKKARCPQCGMIYVVPGSAVSSPANDDPQPTESVQRESGDQPDERWQVRTPDGRVYGPVPKQELDQWFAEGRIPEGASLLRDGDPRWQSASGVYPRLSGGRQRINERDNPFSEVVAPTPFRSVQRSYHMPHRGGVILTLAILGWAICPVFAPFAWAMGNSDLRSIRLGQMDPSGQSLTQAGMILGMIQTILIGIVLIFVCLGSLS